MSSKKRYVFDTNVIVSALLLERSIPGQAFRAAIDQGEILLSLATVKELNEVLSRDKFNRYLHRDERELFLESLLHEATLVEIDQQIRVCRDPGDDKFLELAASGKASCIISGDDDLLALSPFRDIPILTPTRFLASLKE